jgi:hypothetical protein
MRPACWLRKPHLGVAVRTNSGASSSYRFRSSCCWHYDLQRFSGDCDLLHPRNMEADLPLRNATRCVSLSRFDFLATLLELPDQEVIVDSLSVGAQGGRSVPQGRIGAPKPIFCDLGEVVMISQSRFDSNESTVLPRLRRKLCGKSRGSAFGALVALSRGGSGGGEAAAPMELSSFWFGAFLLTSRPKH